MQSQWSLMDLLLDSSLCSLCHYSLGDNHLGQKATAGGLTQCHVGSCSLCWIRGNFIQRYLERFPFLLPLRNLLPPASAVEMFTVVQRYCNCKVRMTWETYLQICRSRREESVLYKRQDLLLLLHRAEKSFLFLCTKMGEEK
ncbi:hypothetical protein XENTR_v10013628 [Xenopus tropicalis]|nr:hypothetical protein XENTR_v10013628 [Xenopus tropicalis]